MRGDELGRHPDRWVRRYAGHALIVVLGLIFISTITPFEFRSSTALQHRDIAGYFQALWRGESNLDDIIHNVLLFLPLGFLLRADLERRHVAAAARVGLIAVLAGALSLGVESVQLWMPARYAALIDVAANTAGALLGAACFNLARLWCRSPLAFVIGGLAYYGLALGVAVMLQGATSLRNWDRSYPLLVGNEGNSKRPWRGYVAQVRAAAAAVGPAEARALLDGETPPAFASAALFDYRLRGSGPFGDRLGRAPDLRWNTRPARLAPDGVMLDRRHWLRGNQMSAITAAIQASDAFTFDLTVASLDPDQSGPARIVSLSWNNSLRNLTIAQSGADLLVRLRTPANGLNGTLQELRAPGVFAGAAVQRIIVSYGRAQLSVYVGDAANRYTLAMAPEPALLHMLLPGALGRLAAPLSDVAYVRLSRALYALLLALPLGASLAWMAALPARSARWHWPLAAGAALLLAIFTEVLVAQVGGRDLRPANIIVMAIIASASLLLFGLRARQYAGGANIR